MFYTLTYSNSLEPGFTKHSYKQLYCH